MARERAAGWKVIGEKTNNHINVGSRAIIIVNRLPRDFIDNDDDDCYRNSNRLIVAAADPSDRSAVARLTWSIARSGGRTISGFSSGPDNRDCVTVSSLCTTTGRRCAVKNSKRAIRFRQTLISDRDSWSTRWHNVIGDKLANTFTWTGHRFSRQDLRTEHHDTYNIVPLYNVLRAAVSRRTWGFQGLGERKMK